MFTGLTECLGTITSIQRTASGAVIAIKPDKKPFIMTIGASLSVNGACLTVEKIDAFTLMVTAVQETLEMTTLGTAKQGDRANLERALCVGDRLDGHFVQGHIDGVGTIIQDQTVGKGMMRTIEIPEGLIPFMAPKGSAAIDGISLTIAKSTGNRITLALIPATVAATTMTLKKIGDLVNIECDVMARYLHHMRKYVAIQDSDSLTGHSLAEKMERLGF